MKLSGCKNLHDLEAFLGELKPMIGKTGGRYFVEDDHLYRMNTIVKRFNALTVNNHIKFSTQLIGRIKTLDKAADTLLSKQNLWIRILTAIKRFFGNLFYDREKVLESINKASDQGKIFSRKYPPVSVCDTAYFDPEQGKYVSVHGQRKLFKEEEILDVHRFVNEEVIGKRHGRRKPIYAWETEDGKFVIQQQATRGCTAAVAAMLIKDHEKDPNIRELTGRNLGTIPCMLRDIRDARLTPKLTEIEKDLDKLKNIIEKDGSAIIWIRGELGGHVIIVDAIDKLSARIRDPYHGWQITVTREALQKRFTGGSVILIASD